MSPRAHPLVAVRQARADDREARARLLPQLGDEVAHPRALADHDDAVAEPAGAPLPYQPLADREPAGEQQHQPDGEGEGDEAAGELELDHVRGDRDRAEDQEGGAGDAAVLLAADAERPRLVAALPRDREQPADAQQHRQQHAVETADTAGDRRAADPEPAQVADGHGDRDGERVDQHETDHEPARPAREAVPDLRR